VSYWGVARTVVLCEQLVCRRLERIGFETYFLRLRRLRLHVTFGNAMFGSRQT
jgi:hypothetical protein